MCGIIGYVGDRPALPILIESLRRMEYRGYDSTGVAVLRDGALAVRKSAGRVEEFARLARPAELAGTVGIGHTRWATHGEPSDANAHPHLDCSGDIAVIHNGIIENFDALKRGLRRRAHRFRSETDTEVIAHLLEERWDRGPAALASVFRRLRGQFAVVAMSRRDPGRVIAMRSGPPLVAGIGRGEMFLASDISALLPYTRKVAFLEDGDIAWITRDGLAGIDRAGRALRRRAHAIRWSAQAAEKGGHPHYMLKEILEQPETLLNVLADRVDARAGDVRFSEPGVGRLPLARIRRVVLAACGTAWHAASVARYWIEDFAGLPASSELASELRYARPALGPDALVVAVSQSGETADTLACVRLAQERGCPVLAIANIQGSTLSREADATVWMRAGLEVGVAATKTYTAQLAALLLLSVRLGRARRALPAARARAILRDALLLPRRIDRAVALRGAVRAAARRLARYPNFMFVGRGVNFPTALEGALKLKEISYRHAEGYGAGEMKHGPLALVDRNLPVIAVCAGDPEIYDKTLSNLHEIRARGADLVVVTDRPDFRAAARDVVLRIPAGRPELTPILAAVPLQLLAYELAAALGRDIDKPRNLAKSVTVE